ncbi:MAG: hypothetical protein Q7U47_11845 [Paludibacter sp.]|nr:hypothetical protein [Paludibacter sp.]
MKKLFYLIALVVFTLTSCNDNEVVQKQSFEEPTPPTFVSKLPSFNAEALYVVGREYETLKDGTSQKSPKFKVKGNVVNANTMTLYEYIEMRLIELYPDVAYVGMAKDMEQEGTQAMQMYKDYLAKRKVWEESQGIFREEEIETPGFTSIEDEIKLMAMTHEEEANFRALNALATSSEFVTNVDLENIFKSKSNTGIQKAPQITLAAALGVAVVVVGVYAVIRAEICKERAENMQIRTDFYGNRTDLLPDAFRHIYVSMMLRRYLSQPTSWLIMDVYQENVKIWLKNLFRKIDVVNNPRDKYMDYHNNNVGRDTQYDLFRDKWWADMHEWELWGTRVRNFVNNTNNGVKKSWLSTTDIETVKNDRNNTDKYKYIWYE